MGLNGGDPMAVSRAVKRGRLVHSVKDGKIVDAELADREWEENTDLSKAPGYVREKAAGVQGDSPENMAEASLREKHWKSKLAELKYKQEAGELVIASEVEREWVDILSHVRTRLLAIPTYVKQAAPHLEVADVALIEQHVRDALEELSRASE